MIERKKSNHRMSQLVIHNDVVYMAGQVAKDSSQGVADQTRQILQQIEDLLLEAGSDKSLLLSANIWLADMSDFQAMNEAWDSWVGGENPPVRACVESRLARPELLVEIQVVAASR